MIGNILKDQEQLAAAEPYFRESQELYSRTQGVESKAYAISTLNVGTNLLDQQRYDEAVAYLTDGVRFCDATFPEQPDYRVRSRLALARCHAVLGHTEEAREQYCAVLNLSDVQGPSDIVLAMRSAAQRELRALSGD